MKTQILVAGQNFYNWQIKFDQYLKEGWTVVPGTLQIMPDHFIVVMEKGLSN